MPIVLLRLLHVLLLLIMAVLGLVLALRKSNDVEWFVWMVVALDGVLLAICTGLLLGRKQKKLRKDDNLNLNHKNIFIKTENLPAGRPFA